MDGTLGSHWLGILRLVSHMAELHELRLRLHRVCHWVGLVGFVLMTRLAGEVLRTMDVWLNHDLGGEVGWLQRHLGGLLWCVGWLGSTFGHKGVVLGRISEVDQTLFLFLLHGWLKLV